MLFGYHRNPPSPPHTDPSLRIYTHTSLKSNSKLVKNSKTKTKQKQTKMSQVAEHKHVEFLTADGQFQPIEVSYYSQSWVKQPWDLEKIDAHPDHEVWIKWNTLYVRFGKWENLPDGDGDGSSTLYEYQLSEPVEADDYKRPNNEDVEDWLAAGEDYRDYSLNYCKDPDHIIAGLAELQLGRRTNRGLISRYDLIPRCKECEEKLGRYQTPERRIAGEKIKAWCLEKLYNPHTKIGKRFAENQIAWAFAEVAKKKKAGKSRRLKIVGSLEVPHCCFYAQKCENPCAEKRLANGAKSDMWGHTDDHSHHLYYWNMCESCFAEDQEE